MQDLDKDDDSRRVCPLCEREIPPRLESRHHLIPKLKGGKRGPVAILHRACHSKIHGVLTEAQLAREFDTVDKLKQHPEIATFVRWISKRPIDFDDGTRSLRRSRRR